MNSKTKSRNWNFSWILPCFLKIFYNDRVKYFEVEFFWATINSKCLKNENLEIENFFPYSFLLFSWKTRDNGEDKKFGRTPFWWHRLRTPQNVFKSSQNEKLFPLKNLFLAFSHLVMSWRRKSVPPLPKKLSKASFFDISNQCYFSCLLTMLSWEIFLWSRFPPLWVFMATKINVYCIFMKNSRKILKTLSPILPKIHCFIVLYWLFFRKPPISYIFMCLRCRKFGVLWVKNYRYCGVGTRDANRGRAAPPSILLAAPSFRI